jgi:hypothetical protein
VTDGKVKIYKKNKVGLVNVPQMNAVSIPQLSNNPSISSNQSNNVINNNNDNNLVLKSSILNLSSFKLPVIDQSAKHIIRAICPQIRKAVI